VDRVAAAYEGILDLLAGVDIGVFTDGAIGDSYLAFGF
jgi:hypothetical protein